MQPLLTMHAYLIAGTGKNGKNKKSNTNIAFHIPPTVLALLSTRRP